MEIFKPPTDNLYKFVAVSGLLIFLASFIVPQRLNRDYLIRFATVDGELRVLRNEIETLEKLREEKKEDDPEIKQLMAEIDRGLTESMRQHETNTALGNYARRS